MSPQPLPAESLSHHCDPASLSFATTDDLEDIPELPGQARATEALRFGLSMDQEGYNLFALGPEGVGRHHLVMELLQEAAKTRPPADDWCYLFDFDRPKGAVALRLPAGRGAVLRKDLARFVEDLAVEIPASFDSDDYRARRAALEEALQKETQEAFAALAHQAELRGLTLVGSPGNLALVPTRDGQRLLPDQLAELPAEDKARLQHDIEEMTERFKAFFEGLPRKHHEHHEKVRALDREFTGRAVGHLVDKLREAWAGEPAVRAHLDAMERDVLANAARFLPADQGPAAMMQALTGQGAPEDFARRYQVNLLVDRDGDEAAPVVYEDNPTLATIAGRIDHRAHLGTLVSDFTQVHAGALHRANGGFLLLDAARLLAQPLAWRYLERALRSKAVRIESPAQALGLASAEAIEPEPIPLDVKVVLVGSPKVYYLLSSLDPEFPALFKVPADFDERMDRTAETEGQLARMLATLARTRSLRPLDKAAVARVVDHAARVADDAERLTTQLQVLDDLLREADHFAAVAKADVIGAEHVQQALDALHHRAGRLRDRSLEALQRDLLHVEVTGTSIGQLNGLMVIELGKVPFARPGRITARVRLGGGEVMDIEREVELGGPIHSKGVLTLTGFLGGRYAREKTLSLAASLVFEQSYGPVEGDSASLAETCALLSALGELPLAQGIAVTGSVDQQGRVQAVGAVNDKIEGFFDVCAARGLTGEQGVIVPAVMAPLLMLRDDVVAAAAEDRFHVWPVHTVDEAMELLTGLPAGERDAKGVWTEGSVNRAVDDKLQALDEAAVARKGK